LSGINLEKITSPDISANTVKLEQANNKRIILHIDFKIVTTNNQKLLLNFTLQVIIFKLQVVFHAGSLTSKNPSRELLSLNALTIEGAFREPIIISKVPAIQGCAGKINDCKSLVLREKENRIFRFSRSESSWMNYSELP
jgi:hypothetical protein